MSYIFGFGEGLCPSGLKKVPVTLDRAELTKIRNAFEKQETGLNLALASLATILTGGLLTGTTSIAAGLTWGAFQTAISDYLMSCDNVVDDMLTGSVKTKFNVELTLGCINQGRNGHYFLIKNIRFI